MEEKQVQNENKIIEAEINEPVKFDNSNSASLPVHSFSQ